MSHHTIEEKHKNTGTSCSSSPPLCEERRARCLPRNVNAFAPNKPNFHETCGVSAKTTPLTASAAIWYIDTEKPRLRGASTIPDNRTDALVVTGRGDMNTYPGYSCETAQRDLLSCIDLSDQPSPLPPAPRAGRRGQLDYNDASDLYARMPERFSALPPRPPSLLMSSPSPPTSLAGVVGPTLAASQLTQRDATLLTSTPPPRDAPPARRRRGRFCRHNDPFGPLLIVVASTISTPVHHNHAIALCDTPPAGTTTSSGTWCSLSRVEAASYSNTIRSLQDALARVQVSAEAARRSAVHETEEAMQRRMADYQADERRRRQQFQKTLDDLREANVALTAQLDAMHCHDGLPAPTASPRLTAPGEATAAIASTTTSRTGVVASTPDAQVAGEEARGAILNEEEWARREQELEVYWRRQMRDAQAHYEASLSSAMRARDELVAQVRQLTRAADELHRTVRQLRDEAATLTAQNAQLRTRCAYLHDAIAAQDAKPVADATREVRRLQSELQTRQARERALLAELEDCGASNAREQQSMAAQLRCVQDALDKERSRSAALVQLYSSQIESLHAQLEDKARCTQAAKLQCGYNSAID